MAENGGGEVAETSSNSTNSSYVPSYFGQRTKTTCEKCCDVETGVCNNREPNQTYTYNPYPFRNLADNGYSAEVWFPIDWRYQTTHYQRFPHKWTENSILDGRDPTLTVS